MLRLFVQSQHVSRPIVSIALACEQANSASSARAAAASMLGWAKERRSLSLPPHALELKISTDPTPPPAHHPLPKLTFSPVTATPVDTTTSLCHVLVLLTTLLLVSARVHGVPQR